MNFDWISFLASTLFIIDGIRIRKCLSLVFTELLQMSNILYFWIFIMLHSVIFHFRKTWILCILLKLDASKAQDATELNIGDVNSINIRHQNTKSKLWSLWSSCLDTWEKSESLKVGKANGSLCFTNSRWFTHVMGGQGEGLPHLAEPTSKRPGWCLAPIHNTSYHLTNT